MVAKWMPPDLDDFVRRYEAGESVNSLALSFNIGRTAINGALDRAGVIRRTASEQEAIKWAGMDPVARAAQVAAAHDAVRGTRRSLTTSMKRTRTLSREGIPDCYVGHGEVELGKAFAERGHKVRHQVPVLGYLCDLFVDGIPVEVMNGGANPRSRKGRQFFNRIYDLLDLGCPSVWAVFWTTGCTAIDYDKAVADFEAFRSCPSAKGQYRVIWGDGQLAATGGLKGDDFTVVLAFEHRQNPATGRYERVAR